MSDNSDNCVECIRLSRDCDLFFFAAKWRRVKKKRDHLFRELKDASKKVKKVNAKASRLQKQFEFMNEKERAMIDREFEIIVELKKKEQTIEFTLNDFLYDVSFEHFEVFSEFNWLNFFAETVAEASDSSWDFPLTLKCSRYVHNLFT